MMRSPNSPNRFRTASRGFTLVEMLVATALVLLMMLLFASVFQTAAGLVSNQKSMAELDQNVRTLTIMLEGDLGQRTFRDVIPFAPVTDPSDIIEPNDNMRGFFSISENDPDNPTDDVLHLTIEIYKGGPKKFRKGGAPDLPFSGKTTLIRYADPSITPATVIPDDDNINDPMERESFLLANRNQPEFDDGQLSINGTGSSRFAEVSWFLRNGTLYRRILLIRDSYDNGGGTTIDDHQARNFEGDNLIPGEYTALNVPPIPDSTQAPGNVWHDAVGRFWYDFDYSAFNDPQAAGGNGLTFHTAAHSLINAHPPGSSLGAFATGQGIPPSLGLPCLRFGNSLQRGLDWMPAPTPAPPPREFLVGTDLTNYDRSTYIGRFTIQETAHSGFTYPSRSPATGGPFQDATSLTLGADGLVTQYSNELGRRGEDIVMTNVHSFDIQVWDDAVRDFVNLGHSQEDANGAPIGDYNANRNTNSTFGNRYDTWHPNSQMLPAPPYRPLDPVTGEPKPLRAIQIKIRFYDVGGDQMRDLTFPFPLID